MVWVTDWWSDGLWKRQSLGFQVVQQDQQHRDLLIHQDNNPGVKNPIYTKIKTES